LIKQALSKTAQSLVQSVTNNVFTYCYKMYYYCNVWYFILAAV